MWFASGDSYEKMGAIVGLTKGQTKELLVKTMNEILPAFWNCLLLHPIVEQLKGWVDFLNAHLVIDTVFQPTVRPSGSVEQREFFSGKHKRHGVKIEVWHSLSGEAVAIYGPFKVSRHDFSIFEEHKEVLKSYLTSVDRTRK